MKLIHKSLSVLMAGIMLLGATVMPVTAADVTAGDLDGSGEVSLPDAVILAKAAAGVGGSLSADSRLAADLNGDGSITSADLTIMLQYIAGIRTTLGSTQSKYQYLCATDLTADVISSEVKSKAPDDAFSAARQAFTVQLLQNEWAQKENQNVLVSPLSVTLALAMTANGAKGDTLAGMEQALGGLTIDDLNAYSRGYIDMLPQSDTTSLSVANSVWFDEARISVPQTFLQTVADSYDASAFRTNFSNPLTVLDINGWCNEMTHGMIPKIVDENDMTDDLVMILMNALAFEAEWMEKYSKDNVSDAEFTAADGTKQTVDMMYSEEYTYLETQNAVGFVKHYTDGYSFAAILPNSEISLSDYITKFDDAEYTALLKGVQHCDVCAGLPKFSYDYSNSLKQTLSAMGMGQAFSYAADFSGMTENPGQDLYIGDVIHKTHIEVGELGTRAGAVTAVFMKETAVADPPKYVVLNRPFLYAIIDNETKLPVFVGTVTSVA